MFIWSLKVRVGDIIWSLIYISMFKKLIFSLKNSGRTADYIGSLKTWSDYLRV